jgi:hypothetical protein
VAEPNGRLRRARERVESPNASGQPLSRQEFAELINAWVYDNTNPRRVIETDAHYIGQWERGRLRWPHDRDRRAGFHTVLCVATDAELGFRRLRRRRSTVAEVDRQQFLRGDARYGGGLLRDAVIAHIRYCAEFLNARCSDRVRTDLLSAVGVLARITARAHVVDQLKLASLVMMRESRRVGEPPKRLAEVTELTHRIGSAVIV